MKTATVLYLAILDRIAPEPAHTRRCECPACRSIRAQIAERRRRDAEKRKERGR